MAIGAMSLAALIAGCGVLTVGLVLVAWGLARNRRPPST
jgi:hypothetical protein